eukprot:TRINITY_DN293_c0_g1_i3.p1 TRINITY_DN293_c0_g1~~TRINITY_DN293_c0_g1_i3.p1  ORF type:complete len:1682 (+),score=307.62 TRINITY_DN293_c0_g1_i3:46-5091(+)
MLRIFITFLCLIASASAQCSADATNFTPEDGRSAIEKAFLSLIDANCKDLDIFIGSNRQDANFTVDNTPFGVKSMSIRGAMNATGQIHLTNFPILNFSFMTINRAFNIEGSTQLNIVNCSIREDGSFILRNNSVSLFSSSYFTKKVSHFGSSTNLQFQHCTFSTSISGIESEGDLRINNSLFTGSLIRSTGSLFLSDSTIKDSLQSSAVTSVGPTQVTRCKFESNGDMRANSEGGALVLSSDANITFTTFSQNRAQKGGAISVLPTASVTISNCIFTWNGASFDAGAIYFKGTGRSSRVLHTEFFENISQGGSLALKVESSTQFHNCTFSKTKAVAATQTPVIKNVRFFSTTGVITIFGEQFGDVWEDFQFFLNENFISCTNSSIVFSSSYFQCTLGPTLYREVYYFAEVSVKGQRSIPFTFAEITRYDMQGKQDAAYARILLPQNDPNWRFGGMCVSAGEIIDGLRVNWVHNNGTEMCSDTSINYFSGGTVVRMPDTGFSKLDIWYTTHPYYNRYALCGFKLTLTNGTTYPFYEGCISDSDYTQGPYTFNFSDPTARVTGLYATDSVFIGLYTTAAPTQLDSPSGTPAITGLVTVSNNADSRFVECKFRKNDLINGVLPTIIRSNNNGDILNLEKTLFENSTVESVVSSVGKLVMLNSVIKNMKNSAYFAVDAAGDASITGCRFESIGQLLQPGALRLQSVTSNVVSSYFKGNKANSGAAIYIVRGAFIFNCTFDQNQASFEGGAIFSEIGGYYTQITRSQFTDNRASNGGSITALSSMDITECTFARGIANNYGGALQFANGTDYKVSSSMFVNNSVTNTGSAGGAINTPDNVNFRFLVQNSTFDGNTISVRPNTGGSAIYSGGSMQIDNIVVKNNKNSDNAAVYIMGTSIVTRSRFEYNGIDTAYDRRGGGLKTFDLANISSCYFEGNQANWGGGLFIGKGANVSKCTFYKNKGGYDAGGIFIEGGAVTRSYLFNNSFVENGGGPISVKSNTTIENFVGNGLESSSNITVDGGIVLTLRGEGISCDRILLGASASITSPDFPLMKVGEQLYRGPTLSVQSVPLAVPTEGGLTSILVGNAAILELNASRLSLAINGIPCTDLSFSPDNISIICNAPSGVGTENEMSNKNPSICFNSNGYSFRYLPPTLESVKFLGDQLTIEGKNLGRVPSQVEILVDGNPCSEITLISNSLIYRCRINLEEQKTFSVVANVGKQPSSALSLTTPKNISTIILDRVKSQKENITIAQIYTIVVDFLVAVDKPTVQFQNENVTLSAANTTVNDGVSVQIKLDSFNSSANFPVKVLDSLKQSRSQNNDSVPAFLVLTIFTKDQNLIKPENANTTGIGPSILTFKALVYELSLLDAKGTVVPVSNISEKIAIYIPFSNPSNDTSLRCFFYDENLSVWSSKGMEIGMVDSTGMECLTDHLTKFTLGKEVNQVVSTSTGSGKPLFPYPWILWVIIAGGGFVFIIVTTIVVVILVKRKSQRTKLKHKMVKDQTEEMEFNLNVVEKAKEGEVMLGKELGKGAQGVVYLASIGGTTEVAVKKLNFRGDKGFIREASILRKLHHPNVVQFLRLYQFHGDHFMMTEYMAGGSLLILLQTIPVNPHVKIRIARDISAALAYLEESGISHNDVSCRNVLMKPGPIAKLSDFGSATQTGEKHRLETKPPVRWSVSSSSNCWRR